MAGNGPSRAQYSHLDVENGAFEEISDSSKSVSLFKKILIIIFSLLTIVGVLLLIYFVLLERHDKTSSLRPFTMDSIFNSSLTPKSFNVQWGGNGQYFIYQNTSVSNDWLKFDLAAKNTSLFVNATELASVIPDYNSYAVSPDGEFILFAVNVSSVWRHSVLAVYLLYTVSTGAVQSLVEGNPLLQNVVWSPVDHKVAYVRDYNIYIFDPTTGTSTQVTADGSSSQGILNGIQSWVYEEEVFSSSSAIWWSRDGSLISYLKFNESAVPIFEYTLYPGTPYPEQIPLRYPKAGFTNPTVGLYIYNLTGQLSFLYTTYGAGNPFEYIATVQWDSQNRLWLQQLNRYQNESSATVLSPQAEGMWLPTVALQQSNSQGWVEVSPFYFCTVNGTEYPLLRLPQATNFQIAQFSPQPDGSWTWSDLTSAPVDVIAIAGCSPDGRVYYTSPAGFDVTDVTLRHLYTAQIGGTAEQARVQVNQRRGVFAATFSPAGDFYVMRYLGPEVPQHFLVETTSTFNLTVQDNVAYTKLIADYELPEKTFTTVKSADGQTLNAYYKKSKYAGGGLPLIIDVYAGPDTQDVLQTYDAGGLDAFLVSEGFVVASIDGRGTGGRGLPFLQATYRQLGLVESADQRAGAKNLTSLIRNVDKNRVAIWGWSFGGFMSAHGIADTSALDNFKYKVAVSVAPVTDWRFYDTIYTERYMSTPQDNPAGYNATSVNVRAGDIPSNSLLLMHGLADDNVHFQNSAEFVSALIQNNVQFETMYYPNNNHAINSGNARRYLYEKMIRFLKDNL